MRFLWAIHLYPPKHCAGAEFMAHTINRFLISKGHQVRVIHYDAEKYRIKSMYEFEGVQVFTSEHERVLFEWADVVLTHLDYSKKAIWTAAQYEKRCYWLAHNDIPYNSVLGGVGDLRVIYNAQWVADKLNYKWPSFVFPPPVDDWYKCDDKGRRYITLINLNDNKGANYFYSLAKKLPQFQFLGVKGSYDGQIIQNLPNVTIWPNTPYIRKVYEVSKIVLMPSHYESWGKVASEAMLNGIPVIANPTPGLKENVGKGGILINRKETGKWAAVITKLMEDAKYYDKWSKAALKRSKEQVPEWEKLHEFLQLTKPTINPTPIQ